MRAAAVFFGVATLLGLLFRGVVELRIRRSVARRPAITDGELCQLKQANRINSITISASLAGLAVVTLVAAVASVR